MFDIKIRPKGIVAEVHHYKMLYIKDLQENTWSISSRISSFNGSFSPDSGGLVNNAKRAWSGFLSFLSKNYSKIVEYIRRIVVKVKQFRYNTCESGF